MKLFGLKRIGLVFLLAAGLMTLLAVSPQAAKSCYDCHSKQKTDFLARKNVHQPVKGENCESCHKRHGFSNKLVLVDNTNQLCFSCHTELKDKYSAGNVHAPVSAGVCWDCHDPHASDKKALLRSNPKGPDDPNSCMGCHQQELASTVDAKFPHEPFQKQDCVGCHDPHNSPNANLLKKDANTLCSACHDVKDKKLATAHEGKFISGLGCADCHSGHSSNKKGLMSETGHPPFQEGSCDACHSLPDANGKVTFAEGTTPGNICANCHADQAAGAGKKFPHAAVEAANCDNCHTAHSSPYGMLLKMDEKQLCKQCHEDIANNAQMKQHAPAESGLCGRCHEVHGSDTKALVKKSDAGLCLECHKAFATARDSAKTVHAGAQDCLTCHDPHGQSSPNLWPWANALWHSRHSPASLFLSRTLVSDP